ncbi:MAG: PaaI family thioesterase [Elusimicrobiaceae bacterium]|nr:PaaI family thioesterase [Elusimicrobiaceae bacterium]
MKKLRQPTSLNCFACGKNNPFGLHLEWFNDYENKQVETTFTLGDNYCSYPGTVHGGIIATILDETSGRAVLLGNDFNNLMVTLKMEVTYKHNTPTNTPLRAVGRMIKGGTTRAQVEGEIILPDGTVTAKCVSLLYKMPDAVRAKWGPEAEEWERTTPSVSEGCPCHDTDNKTER